MNIRTMYFRAPSTKTNPKDGRPENGTPLGCVVTLLNTDNTISYQVSSRNPLDEYNRKTGREIAVGRLITAPVVVSLDDVAPKRHAILRAVLLDIANHPKEFPKKIWKSADRWLKDHPSFSEERSIDAVIQTLEIGK